MQPNPLIENTQGQVDPCIIDLGVGHPKTTQLPIEKIFHAVQTRFEAGNPYFLQYGVEQGDGHLRLNLADFLSDTYGFQVEPRQLFITSGASSGLDLACTLFSHPGDFVIVEEPTYFLALKIFADHYLTPIAVPVDEEGLDIDALDSVLSRYRVRMLYTVPSFQNPSGRTLSDARRERLVSLSKEHNFLIVADEVYHFLGFSHKIPKPLAGFTEEGNVISLGSFSKILAPGLRLGWIQTDQEHIRSLVQSGLLVSGGGMNPFTSAMLRGLLENGGLQANIEALRRDYNLRANAMDSALRQYMPGATYHLPQGGYFFWVQLPGEQDAHQLLERALAFQVAFKPGALFSCAGGLRDYARLCLAYYDAQELEEGIRRLSQALPG